MPIEALKVWFPNGTFQKSSLGWDGVHFSIFLDRFVFVDGLRLGLLRVAVIIPLDQS